MYVPSFFFISLLTQNSSNLLDKLDVLIRSQHFQDSFHLPAYEIIETSFDCKLQRLDNTETISGKMFLSPQFICYCSSVSLFICSVNFQLIRLFVMIWNSVIT